MRGAVDRVAEGGDGFLIGPNGEEYFFQRPGLTGLELEEIGPGITVEYQAAEEPSDTP